MSKPVKELITNDLRSRYHGQDTALWVEIVGADGVTTNNFRRELRAKGIRLEIVKNSLLRRACAGGPLAPMANALAGPAALVTGGESLIDAAKLIEAWIPKIKGMKLRGAVLEGEYLDEQDVTGLSRMPTRQLMCCCNRNLTCSLSTTSF